METILLTLTMLSLINEIQHHSQSVGICCNKQQTKDPLIFLLSLVGFSRVPTQTLKGVQLSAEWYPGPNFIKLLSKKVA